MRMMKSGKRIKRVKITAPVYKAFPPGGLEVAGIARFVTHPYIKPSPRGEGVAERRRMRGS